MSIEEKNHTIEFSFYAAFDPVMGKSKYAAEEREKRHWNNFIKGLEMHSAFYKQHPISKSHTDGRWDKHFNISNIRLAYVYAIINDERVNRTLDSMYCDLEQRHLSNNPDAWWNDKNSLPRFYVDFYQAIKVFDNIGRCYFILPYIIKYTELVKNVLEKAPNYSEAMLFEWYTYIIDCAEKAQFETSNPLISEVLKEQKEKINNIINNIR